jgi:hypothetical protein
MSEDSDALDVRRQAYVNHLAASWGWDASVSVSVDGQKYSSEPRTDLRVTEVRNLECPAEWVVRAANGRTFDVHYRWGELRVWQRPHDYDDRMTVWRAQVGDEFDGSMDDEVMLAHLARAGIGSAD